MIDKIPENPPPPYSGGGQPSYKSAAPNAMKLFRNSSMTIQNWETIEKMIVKIINNCLGKGLYDGLATVLKDKKLIIEFNNSGNTSWFNFSTGTISLDMTGESNRLFHEMWHAYQAYQETPKSWDKSKLNNEIEAWYAQYLYLKDLPEYSYQTHWSKIYNDTDLGKAIQNISVYIDHKGRDNKSEYLIYSYLVGIEQLFREMPEYSEKLYPFDYERGSISNFKNLRNLSHNCD